MDQLFVPPATYHEKHWVSDGNIVLSAVSAQKEATILYRVHRSLLSDQSEVFTSMFELPQGEGNSQVELYNGLPLVRLPDTAEEVCALLDALRNSFPLSEKSLSSDTPIRIRGALHMSSKYLMTDLRASLVHIFENEWPLTVEEFDAKDQLLQDYLLRGESIKSGWPAHFIPEPAAAISLAEEYDIPNILPAAYYDILRCAPQSDWSDLEKANYSIKEQSEKPARWRSLSGDSFRKIHRLQDILLEEMRATTGFLEGAQGFMECPRNDLRPELCMQAWTQFIPDETNIPIRPQERDYFLELRRLKHRVENSQALCLPCRTLFIEFIGDARLTCWERIRWVVCFDN